MNERAILKAFFEWFLRLVLPPGRPSRWTLGPNSGVDVGVGLKGVLGAGTGQIYFAADRIHDDGRTERQRFISSYLTGAIGLRAEIPNVTFSLESFPSDGAIFYGMKGDDFRSAADFCGECIVVQLGGGLIIGGQATSIGLGLSRNAQAYIASAVAFAEEARTAWRDGRLTFELLRKMAGAVRSGYALVRDGTFWRGQIRSRGAIAGLQAGVGLQVSFGVVERESGQQAFLPGRDQHESGSAIDVANYSKIRMPFPSVRQASFGSGSLGTVRTKRAH